MQAVHNVDLCQKVAVLYNVRTKTLSFRKTCHYHKGPHVSQQCLCHKSNTRCCVYSRNTVHSWAQLLLNEVGFIHLPSTETCISPKMREIVGLLLMQGKSPFITLVEVIHQLLCLMNAAGSP